MQCRSCGTEIADRAIVCYRCGQATTDPVRRPVSIAPRRSPILSLGAAAALVLLALSLAYVSPSTSDPARWQMAAGVLVGAAAIVVVLGLLRRRASRVRR